MSILPIGKDTLVYGSGDGGKTIHTDDPSVNKIMETLGKRLNLAPHIIGRENQTIFGPG